MANEMTKRFIKNRWSIERRAIDAMTPGETKTFATSSYFNVKMSVERSNDAYAGKRKWEMKTVDRKCEDGIITVNRIL